MKIRVVAWKPREIRGKNDQSRDPLDDADGHARLGIRDTMGKSGAWRSFRLGIRLLAESQNMFHLFDLHVQKYIDTCALLSPSGHSIPFDLVSFQPSHGSWGEATEQSPGNLLMHGVAQILVH